MNICYFTKTRQTPTTTVSQLLIWSWITKKRKCKHTNKEFPAPGYFVLHHFSSTLQTVSLCQGNQRLYGCRRPLLRVSLGDGKIDRLRDIYYLTENLTFSSLLCHQEQITWHLLKWVSVRCSGSSPPANALRGMWREYSLCGYRCYSVLEQVFY